MVHYLWIKVDDSLRTGMRVSKILDGEEVDDLRSLGYRKVPVDSNVQCRINSTSAIDKTVSVPLC